MPQEWRFAGLLAALRNACARADGSRVPAEIADAFVDRAPIDWGALLTRVRTPGDRALIENLRRLDLIRIARPSAADPATRRGRTFLTVRAVLVLALAQTAWVLCAIGYELVIGRGPARTGPEAVLALAFFASSLLLGAAASRDRRSIFLMTAFAAAASAFAHAALSDLPAAWSEPVGVLFRGVFPEAFAPAALWEFALIFPRVRRFTTFDVVTRQAAALAWFVSSALFIASMAVAYGVANHELTGRLSRSHPDQLFWHVFVLSVLPAVVTILVRSRRAPEAERRKVVRLAAAIAAGTAPFLLGAVLRIAVPSSTAWLQAMSPRSRWGLDVVTLGALASMPVLSTIAVITDRTFELRAFAIQPLLHRLVRGSVAVAVVVPFGMMIALLYRWRDLRLVEIVSGSRGWLLLIGAAAGAALLSSRARLLAMLEARGVRRVPSHHARLAQAMERIRVARGDREIRAALVRELKAGLGVETVRILVPETTDGSTGMKVSGDGESTPVHAGTVLTGMVRHSREPLDLSPDGPLLHLLPAADRAGIEADRTTLAAPLRYRDGALAGIVALGPTRNGRGFDGRDRWLITTLISGAAAALGSVEATAVAHGGGASDDVAFECARCGLVTDLPAMTCGCTGEAVLAAVPRCVGGKFLVQRRLGKGGMGIVYKARDLTLDRDVALKALPDLSGGTVGRLRKEARAMAALNHESLATIYGLELWRRTPILVVEYLAGGTLAQRVSAGARMPVESAVALGVRLASALSYMHARHVLHGDIKPSNIAFTRESVPKLLDFGLATLIEPVPDDAPVDLRNTGRRVAAGTPAYLPPEALSGAPPGPALDLWALALVVLEAMTGRNPFAEGVEPSAQHVRLELASNSPPSVHALPLIVAFFDRALAPEPALRFDSAGEIQRELQSLAVAMRR
jgi:hypothetical protein